MSARIRVACAGAGYFSRFHLDSWARLDAVEVVGIADPDIAAALETRLPAFETARQMIEETHPDLLDVITPPAVQAETIREALAGGVSTVVCQKPFCASLAEAEQIAEAAERAGTRLIVHENFRFMPWYRFLKAELEAGWIGELLQATFRLRPGDGQGPRAYLDRQPYFRAMPRFLIEETAVHWIDTFRFLLGDPISVYADLRRLNPDIAGEDAGYVLFEYPGGLRALFDGNRHLDHASDNLRRTMGEALFEGSKGTLALFGDGRVEFRGFGTTRSDIRLAPDTWDGFGGDCVHALQSHVVTALRDGKEPENSAREYLAVLRIREAIYRSAASGCKVSL